MASRLDRLADRPALMFLRIAMEEQWVKAVRRSFPSYDLSPLRRFIPIEEAGKRMGLSREWVDFHVSTGLLRSSVGVSDPQTTLIDAKSIDYFLRARIQILTTRTTAAELGVQGEFLINVTLTRSKRYPARHKQPGQIPDFRQPSSASASQVRVHPTRSFQRRGSVCLDLLRMKLLCPLAVNLAVRIVF